MNLISENSDEFTWKHNEEKLLAWKHCNKLGNTEKRK